MRKHFKKIVILSLFFLLASGFGYQDAVSQGKGKGKKTVTMISMIIDEPFIQAGRFTGCGESKGTVEPVYTKQTVMHSTTTLLAKHIKIDLSYFLSKTFKETKLGEVCFEGGCYGDQYLGISKENDGTAHAGVHFWGFVHNEERTEILYCLRMYGIINGDWPPADGEFTEIDVFGWEMTSEGRGKLKKDSCTFGEIAPPDSITILVGRKDI
jgi:hypothetical protein